VSPSGLTITDASGAPIAVTTNRSTTFNATTASTFASLVTGEQIQVTGSTGADGTVTATAIRVGSFAGSGGPNTTSPGA
jgi:subtilase family serine protease